MNINTTTVELDELIMGNFNAEDLQNRSDRLGFYKKSEHAYVITTRNLANRPDFNTKILDLASILNTSQYSPEAFAKLSADHSYMVIRYMNCVYKVIDKHNRNAENSRANLFIWVVSLIPLIGRIVNVFYYTIQNPTEFIERYKEQQKQKVETFFENVGNLRGLQSNKSQLDRALSLASRETESLHGQGLEDPEWSFCRRTIVKAFETALEKKSPGLAKARTIMQGDAGVYLGDIGVKYEEIEQKAQQLIQELNITDEVNNMATEGQKELREQAINRIKLGEAAWILRYLQQKYQLASQIRELPRIQDLLGVDQPLAMARRYVTLHKALILLNESGSETRNKLQRSFGNYIQPLIDNLLVDAMDASRAKTAKEVKDLFEQLATVVEAYKLYRSVLNPNQDKDAEIERKESDLKIIRDRKLCKLVPLYGTSRQVLNLGNYQNVPLLTFSNQNASSYSEAWYQEKLSYFEYELTKIDQNEFSQETYEIIMNAHKYLKNQYARCQQERMEKVVREQSQAKGLLGYLGTMIFGKDTGQEQPTKMYKDSLKKLLNAKDEQDLFPAYERKIRELNKLPDSIALKEIIQTAFVAYNRALEIQPLLKKVASGLFSSGELTMQDVNSKNKGLEAFREDALSMLKLFENEIDIQMQSNNHGLVANLQKTRSQIMGLLDRAICDKYPQYKKLLEFQTKYEGKGFKEGNKEYKDVIQEIELAASGEDLPAFISNAAVKAKLAVTYAYKEWEANRIIRVKARYGSELSGFERRRMELQIYDLPANASERDVKMKIRELYLLLHPDRNGDLPERLKAKVDEASKILGAIQQSN